MRTDAQSEKSPWETPATVAITDTGSRTDQPDVDMPNGRISPQ